jgi:arylsulfatase A-like enzyme
LALSAWCGLVAGLLEVGTILMQRLLSGSNSLYWTTRHFVWLIPLIDLTIFVLLGAGMGVVAWCSRRGGHRLAARLLGALTLLPPVWVAFPQIYGPAGFLLTLGAAAQLVPVLERHAIGFRRLVRSSFPVVAGLVPILAAGVWGSDGIAAWREEMRPLPPQSSPNVLLVVLDTVAAGHLALYGYDRPTSPTIDELAARGIRFDRARAASSWTLPSHASLFTGRWPHELSANWLTPLDASYPTLAEFLGLRGYATAGFTANKPYCVTDSGLARGFTVYRDYDFPRLTAFKTAVLFDRPLAGIWAIERFLEDRLDFDLMGPAVDLLWRLFKIDKKETAVVNREFLDWLSRRRQPERPFFAFLNYFEAHYPYELPEKAIHRFGDKPRNVRESTWLRDWQELVDKGPSPKQIDFVRDAYDDCVADLDEKLGVLIDELRRRSLLERTWVIITADHGESFGEKPGVFWHGTSLYRSQLHVPLVMVPPAGGPVPRVVTEPVSLRDLAATIAKFADVRGASAFPGATLARFWDGSSPPSPAVAAASDPVLSEVVPLPAVAPYAAERFKTLGWPLAALTDGQWSYIRREGPVREELYRDPEDARQLRNLAGDPALQPTLERLREILGRLTAGPLTPRRFSP